MEQDKALTWWKRGHGNSQSNSSERGRARDVVTWGLVCKKCAKSREQRNEKLFGDEVSETFWQSCLEQEYELRTPNKAQSNVFYFHQVDELSDMKRVVRSRDVIWTIVIDRIVSRFSKVCGGIRQREKFRKITVISVQLWAQVLCMPWHIHFAVHTDASEGSWLHA